jgi:anaphase-promoting complex subunit 7
VTEFNYYLYLYADIKYQIHVCHVNLKQNHQAIVVLQSIPGKLRNAKINMALAKLYQQGGMERSAITSYKEVLRVWSLIEIIDVGGLT